MGFGQAGGTQLLAETHLVAQQQCSDLPHLLYPGQALQVHETSVGVRSLSKQVYLGATRCASRGCFVPIAGPI